MKLSFLKIRTNSQLKHNKTARTSMPYTNASSVGILFSAEDRKKHDEIKALIHKLEHDGKKVQVMSFLPNSKENYEFMFDFFTMKEVSFFGQITSNHAIKFSETPFDYLFCLDAEPNPMVLHLLARSKAKCRVGKFQELSTPYFELMIDNVDKQVKGLIDGIYKYTAQLK